MRNLSNIQTPGLKINGFGGFGCDQRPKMPWLIYIPPPSKKKVPNSEGEGTEGFGVGLLGFNAFIPFLNQSHFIARFRGGQTRAAGIVAGLGSALSGWMDGLCMVFCKILGLKVVCKFPGASMMPPDSSGRGAGPDSAPCVPRNGIFDCAAAQCWRVLGFGPQGSAELFPRFTPTVMEVFPGGKKRGKNNPK